ncbi:MAG: tRNA uridine-5-carboxymethylaminomethyl(34) synthesis GTPase MnmE [Erysipelotrichaceae bacterium]|nr:tRNA uridine-5-carboxymethylaminomethyl(34) synthesis GTPase MnmE [Erysipelotrichaceae bacterium]
MSNSLDDIIIGISTALSEGAISIIRLSGKGCIELVNRCFKGKNLTKALSHTINYGYIIDENKEIVDEVLVSVFRAPKTYTTEDVVEINCHGGLFVTNKIYELLVILGARPSEAGEFTKRAFLNGRIDLTKAEAVMDMISAENSSALKIASRGLLGFIKRTVDDLRKRLLDVVATISVNIDYPEYDDVQMLTTNEIRPGIESIYKDVVNLLEKSKSAKYLKNGVDTAIVGRPNVGKSSLLNALLEEQKAIVTNIPGTTRDLVEAKINLGSVTLNLIDTAGIRETIDIVEQIGVSKSLDVIEKAELVLLVLDGSEKLTNEDLELLDKVKDKKHLVIVNKDDLGLKIDLTKLNNPIVISTTNEQSIDELKNSILSLIKVENIQNKDITYISNARQIEKLKLAKLELEEALKEIEENAFIDFVDIHLRASWMYLGEIIGETSSESLLDELFSKFCLGK